MGQLCSGKDDSATPSKSHAKSGRVVASSSSASAPRPSAGKYSYQLPAARRDKYQPPRVASRDPADYESSKLVDGTWIRQPGDINDQRITIEDAKGSTFLLLDHCDSVQVDECSKCTFFIGPTTGSVFLRGLRDCRVVVLCGQLRLRDCRDTDIATLCRSRPVIESSKNIGIGCFSGPQYLDLRWQLARASLSVWNNLHAIVHDFTPEPGNWHPLSQDKAADLIPNFEALLPAGSECAELDATTRIVPYTSGWDDAKAPTAVVLFRAGMHDESESAVHAICGSGVQLLETGEVKLSEEVVRALAAVDTLKSLQLRAGDVHPVAVIASWSATGSGPEEWNANEAVARIVSRGEAAAVRDALLGRAGADSGFGQAL